MNKKALKEFAIHARNELRSQIALRAQAFGITPKGSPVVLTGTDYVEVYGKKYPIKYKNSFQKLIKEIETKGYDNVIEEVAYTWFNRLIAIRFMEVHNYLPSKVRILSSETKGKVDPDILTEYQYTELLVNKNELANLSAIGNREEAFRILLIAQCNELNKIMPFLFEKLEDYTELLLPNSLIHADSLINKLGKEIGDENFEQVEVIGWLYQYYVSEKKDEVFADLKKNKKITKDNIPAATQLFTPNWIVRYLVENTLGHMWIESHPKTGLRSEMKYYVEPGVQSSEIQEKLKILSKPNLSPEEITILDPACGSGHMLVYAFDLLYKIYEDRGYPTKEIPSLILEKNLFGIDIDDRAVQLASFALLMKAREKTKRIFRYVPKLNVISIQESNNFLINQTAELIGDTEYDRELIMEILNSFIDAKNFGSLLQFRQFDFDKYIQKIQELKESGEHNLENFEVYNQLDKTNGFFVQAKFLASKYDVVITNPPYMGAKGMNLHLTNYIKKYYKDVKSDLFSVFMERCNIFMKINGYHGEINQHSWMFLSSFEKLRQKILTSHTIYSMIHLGARTFEEIGGEVVQSTAFILRNINIKNYISSFFRLLDKNSPLEKEYAFLRRQNLYRTTSSEFFSIPGAPIAYWVSKNIISGFKEIDKLDDIADAKKGLFTGDDQKFLRLWYEVNWSNLGLGYSSSLDAKHSGLKWFPINKGGPFRKWYGNQEFVINWYNDGEELKGFEKFGLRNPNYYFKKGLSWSRISSSNFGVRYYSNGFLFSDAGCSIFIDEARIYELTAILCSKIPQMFLKVLNPTLTFQVGDISKLPIIETKKIKVRIEKLAIESIDISKNDWDSFENSWNFKKHVLLSKKEKARTLEECYTNWEEYAKKQLRQLQQNEEELNNILIEMYGLQDELTPEVQLDEITIRRADRVRETKSFLSFCIGLMMGRFSLDKEGIAFAGGEWDYSIFQTFQPDKDGIIPITENEYFEDDVITRLQELLVLMFGQDMLLENIRWLAESLILKANETPIERLRRYFFDEFFADHCKIYQKRPIYWLAESGAKKGFRALFYLHRFTPETLATIRFSYIQNLQEKIRLEQKRLEQDLEKTDLTVSMKKRFEKQLLILKSQQDELIDYDKKLAELTNQRIILELDDGVIVNYEKLKKVLAKIK